MKNLFICHRRIIDMMSEVVKYGPVWVCSAGNEGPALSTISTPPNVNSNALIGKLYILPLTYSSIMYDISTNL